MGRATLSIADTRSLHYLHGSVRCTLLLPAGQCLFPPLNTLSAELHVSDELIALTLRFYMIFQGLAPLIYGDLADMRGRRPAYIAKELCGTVHTWVSSEHWKQWYCSTRQWSSSRRLYNGRKGRLHGLRGVWYYDWPCHWTHHRRNPQPISGLEIDLLVLGDPVCGLPCTLRGRLPGDWQTHCRKLLDSTTRVE